LLKYFFDTKVFDFSVKTFDAYSLLHIAAQGEFPAITEFLLKLDNFDVNAEAKASQEEALCGLRGLTPIMLATLNKEIENIKLLLQYGASIEQEVDHSDEDDREGILEIDKESAVQFYPDFYAAATGNIELLQDIKDSQITDQQKLEGGINRKITSDGWSLLHVAAEKNCPEVIEYLIHTCFMDVDQTNDDEMTPLHIAAMNNNADNIEALLNAGANPYLKGAGEETALGNAINLGYDKVVKLLIPYFKKDDREEDWLSPFSNIEEAIQYAQEQGFDRIVEMLSKLEDSDL